MKAIIIIICKNKHGIFIKFTFQTSNYSTEPKTYLLLTSLFTLEKSNDRLVPDINLLRKHLLREGHINKADLIDIIKEATSIMSK